MKLFRWIKREEPKKYGFDTKFRHDGWTPREMSELLDKVEKVLADVDEDLADEVCSISTALVVEFWEGAKGEKHG